MPIAVGAQVAGRWYDRAGVRPSVLSGLTISTIGIVGWAAALPELSYLLQLPGMILTGLGLGLLMSPTNTDALGRVTGTERAQASGLVQTVRQLGGTLGIAVIGALILGYLGTDATRDRAAIAITVGFAAAAVAFALALFAGLRLLSRTRVTESGDPPLAEPL